MTQTEIISFYKKNLKKVKEHHNPKNATSSIHKESCLMYINFAKQQLKEAKNKNTLGLSQP